MTQGPSTDGPFFFLKKSLAPNLAPHHNNSMKTTTEVLCSCCSDVAHTFERNSEESGLTKACDSCGILGRVDIDADDDGRTYIRFFPLTEKDALNADQCVLIDAYLKNQEIIDRLMHQVDRLMRENETFRAELVNNRVDVERLINKVNETLKGTNAYHTFHE
jgi:hypothetical protein